MARDYLRSRAHRRAIHTMAIGRSPFARLLVGDGKGYDAWAATIASGDWVGKETFYQAPLYPYALAVLYTGAGRDPMTIRWAQALPRCARLRAVGPSRAPLARGARGSGRGRDPRPHPPAVFSTGSIQKGGPGQLLDVRLARGPWRLRRVSPRRAPFASGVVLGLFALTRENALVFLVIPSRRGFPSIFGRGASGSARSPVGTWRRASS